MRGVLRNYIPVVTISAAFALVILSNLIVTFIRQPEGTVNLLTGHYFEDYFEYLAFIKQGADGNLILHNPYNGKDAQTLVFPWISYAFTGFFLSGILRIPPVYAYWVSSFFQLVILFVLSYMNISMVFPNGRKGDKILAFLVFLFSSSLFSLDMKTGSISPYGYWYSNGSPVSRFGPGTIHHITANIILFAGMYVFYRKTEGRSQGFKNTVFFTVSSALLFLGSPQMALFAGSFFLARLFLLKQREAIAYAAMTFLLVPLFLLYREMMKGSVYELGFLWDRGNYVYPGALLFALTGGVIVFTGIAGAFLMLKKRTEPVYAFFCTTLIAVFFALVPVYLGGQNILSFLGMHNLRFMTPVIYIFPAVATIVFFRKIFRNSLIYYLIISLYFVINLISFQKVIRDHIEGPYGAAYLLYMPNDMYEGIKRLEKTNKEGIVLTSPSSVLGLAVPAISGRDVFIGRSIFTSDIGEKAKIADDFYSMRMGKRDAEEFLRREGITHILLSQADASPDLLMDKYSFLKKVFSEGRMSILENKL